MAVNINETQNSVNRKRRSTISLETLKNVYSMINNKSAREIARDIHLSNPSAYNLINKVTLTDGSEISLKEMLPKSGKKKTGLAEQQVLLANLVQEDLSLTQKGMRTYLKSKTF
ncbi:hypothetical protein CDIK_4262 [Cucumispora dikerogammari]|nr:hypothetical protein CDIK_4262 [Cucumispora dikerogammari]